MKTNACGKCDSECAVGNAVVCGLCESWYHSACIEGMTTEFVKCCHEINKFYGGFSFLCWICQKNAGKLNRNKELVQKMMKMEAELATAAHEKKVMTEKIANLEARNNENMALDRLFSLPPELVCQILSYLTPADYLPTESA